MYGIRTGNHRCADNLLHIQITVFCCSRSDTDRLIGKLVALMSKEDKVRAIHFLNEHGALLVTKSGDKIAKHFGISKYTLYSYLDVKTGGKSND